MTSPNTPRPRVAWFDFAKGICIFLVVMLHTTHHVEEDRWQFQSWLSHVVEFARPFRMPDFFLLAGLFLANTINRPWRRYLDTKVVHFFYFYALWLTIIFLFMDVRISASNGWAGVESLFEEYLLHYLDPAYPLWFIHSLPIYFVLCRLWRNVPWWIIWGGAAVLEMSNFSSRFTVPDQFILRFVYFYSGYVFAPRIFKVAKWAMDNRAGAIGYLACWAIINQTCVSLGWSTLPGVSLALGYGGAFAVIFTACVLCCYRWMDWLRYLGQNSIVVYLGFMIPMVGFTWLFRSSISDVGTAAMLVTIGAVGGSVLMYWVADRSFLRFLYKRPKWARIYDDSSAVSQPSGAVSAAGETAPPISAAAHPAGAGEAGFSQGQRVPPS